MAVLIPKSIRMKRTKPIFRLTVLLAAVAGIWQAGVAADEIVLARMTGATVTSADVLKRARDRLLLRNEPFTDVELFRNLVTEAISDEFVSLEAQRVDLETDWQHRTRRRRIVTSTALRLYQNEELMPTLVFDSAQIDSYYNAHIERYTVPRAQRRVRQITVFKVGHQVPDAYSTYVDPVYQGWDPKRKIDSIYTRLANGEDFNALADVHSEELKAKATHGELGWISPKSVAEDRLTEVFFSLPLHMISKPFETSYGWHIAQVTGERGVGPAPIDQFIRSDIILGLQEEVGMARARSITDSLVEAGTLEYDEELLALADSLIQPGMVLAVINGRDSIWGATYKVAKHADASVRLQPFLSADAKRAVLKPWVRMTFLYGAMREMGYLDRDEVQEALARQNRQHAEDVVRLRSAPKTVVPDSAAIERFYQTHLMDFAPPRRHEVELRRFADADSARAAASAWRQDGQHPAGTIAQWVAPEDLPPPVWNKMTAAPTGTVVGPIAAKGEYWLVHLDQIAPPKPLNQVWSMIAAQLREQDRQRQEQQWFDAMARRYNLVRYDNRLRQVVLPARSTFADTTAGETPDQATDTLE
jgi:parvulin-like peptidyl-prolyl isomerase